MTTDIGIEGRIKHVQDVRAKHGGIMEDSWKHPLGNRVLLDAGVGVGALLSAFLDRLFTAGACKPVQVTI